MSEPLTDDLRRRTLDAMRTLRRQGHMRPQDVEEMIAAMNHPDASADLVTGILAAASLDDLFRRSDHEASTATAWDQLCAAVADGDHLRTAYCARVVCLPDDNPGPLGSAHPGLVQVMHALAEDISVLWPDDTPVDPEPVDAAVRVAAGPVGVAVLHAAAALAVELFDFGSDAAAMDAWAGEPLAERLSDDAEASELLTALVPDVTASADEAVTAAARVHLTLEQLRPVTP